jgi:flagellar biosynthesis protein FlhF
MRIKTLTAPHMADALKIIREQLGPEALILHTRKVKTPDGKPTLEITAAVDEQDTPTLPLLSPPPKGAGGKSAPGPTTLDLRQLASAQAQARDARGRERTPRDAAPAGPTLAATLKAHDLNADLVTRITEAAQGLEASGFAPVDALEMLLGKLLRFTPPQDLIARGKAHALVGPSGVGKTTLIAKLGIHAKRQGLTVGLMSLDDQKIAGFEPLHVAAKALGEKAYLIRDTNDLATAARQLGPRHLILIDTPGLNPYRRQELNAFRARLENLKIPLTAHLVLPATHNPAELEKLPLAFGGFNPASLLFSKLDETVHMGGIVSVAHDHNMAVGVASDNADFATPPLTLTARWLAENLARFPQQPWEFSNE